MTKKNDVLIRRLLYDARFKFYFHFLAAVRKVPVYRNVSCFRCANEQINGFGPPHDLRILFVFFVKNEKAF